MISYVQQHGVTVGKFVLFRFMLWAVIVDHNPARSFRRAVFMAVDLQTVEFLPLKPWMSLLPSGWCPRLPPP